MAQEDDYTAQIEKCMSDEKEWVVLSKYLKSKYIPEIATFHDYNVKYQNENDASKRKELADRMIVKFLTLDGDATLADHTSCYRDMKRRLKKLKQKDYPTDLFIDVHDKIILSITILWDEFVANKK
eukprot:267742_1